MYIDVHTHAHFAAFAEDWQAVIDRAVGHNIWLINVGTQKDTSLRALEVARGYPKGVYATVGLHPIHTAKSYHDVEELGGSDEAKGFTSRGEAFDYEYYKKLALDPKVVAIGECGLDYYRATSDPSTSFGASKGHEARETQKKVFLEHARLANDVKKPLMIHCRPSGKTDDAYEDLLSLVTDYSLLVTPVFHFYVGSPAMTEKLLESGAYFPFGGVVSFARDYDQSITMIPLDRILSETDAPYVSPVPYRGQRNEPAYVIEVVKKLAELKGVSLTEIEERIFENAKTVFDFG